MPTDAKRKMVSELTELLAGSPSAIVTDYRGLTVSEIATVRRTLRERGITYRVIKNRLARIAARDAGLSELDPLLEGPSALAVGDVDEIVLARSFLEAVRPYRTVTVRGGLLRGRRIESAAVDRLATLPGRDVLLGQLAGGMVAPLSAMASLLSAPLRNLGYALQQVVAQKEASGAAAGSAQPAAGASKPEAGAGSPKQEADSLKPEADSLKPEAAGEATTPAADTASPNAEVAPAAKADPKTTTAQSEAVATPSEAEAAAAPSEPATPAATATASDEGTVEPSSETETATAQPEDSASDNTEE